MAAIGATGILAAPGAGFIHWFLLLFGSYMVLSGIFLVARPGKFAEKTKALLSGPLHLWIIRAAVKCSLGLGLALWGAMLVFA